MTQPPNPGEVQNLGSDLRAVLAPNPSPMTYWGTNSFILGRGDVAIVDPGPDDPAHLEALLAAVAGENVTHILITHAHLDHSALATKLAVKTSAPILGFGPPEAGRSARMERFARTDIGGGEGVDKNFVPDQTLSDGEKITADTWQVEPLWTPGHFAGHLCFDIGEGRILSGDLVMGWASTFISPPDGDVEDFLTSCEKLRARQPKRLFPAHGAAIDTPEERINWLIKHRLDREAALVVALKVGLTTLPALTEAVYGDIPTPMHPAAQRNLLAHLIALEDRGEITAAPALTTDAVFRPR